VPRQHDFYGRLRDPLMAVEIELEALAQNLFVDFADAALPGRAGIRDRDIDAAEICRHLIERRAHGGGIRHVALNRQRGRADRLGLLGRGGKIDIEERDFGARRGERFRRGGADCAGGAGDGDDLAGERQLSLRAELFLFERPILAIEHVGFGDRLEAADGFGIADGFDPGLGNVSGDHGVTLRQTKSE